MADAWRLACGLAFMEFVKLCQRCLLVAMLLLREWV